ncbi:MAG TPA: alginate lyase family protein [Pyrinomonadaceae bacterium]|nr:alginate lyase family protein [Pyrinomonadaceae bacterium]
MKIQRLTNVSFEELRVRIGQRLAMVLERHGRSRLTRLGTEQELYAKLSCGREIRSDRELLEMFQARTQPTFFAAFTDREKTTQDLRRRLPEAVPQIIAEADAVVGGRFNLLGFQDLSFGDLIDWHLEPVSGKRAPLIHWSRLNFLDADLAGDKKVVWELNRHQYFVTLGQAYWLTGDEKYARTFINHLESWMDQNPPKLGINWASSLEVAFRSISWLWAFYFFKDSPAFEPKTFLRAWKFLYLNALHLETYLSTYFSPNTHLTGEALGLFYVGTLLPEFKEAARWRNKGAAILVEQLPRHVKSDGVYFEQSSYYHRYTTDFYTHFLILLRANRMAVPDLVESKLIALLDHLMYIQRPDGTTPLFGDDDGGKLLMVDPRRSNDFRGTLSTGAALFQRPDYKYVADGARLETLWLLGPEGLREFDQLETREPASQSVAFTEGGYYVMRDGWSRTSNYLWFDCGPHGMLNCGHAHADALSFEVAVRGRSLLVDPGTYTYTGSKEERDWFRSSVAHNTLTIDRTSSSESAGPFSWKTIARCEGLNWISSELFDFVKGKHDGYSRLTQPAEHTRSILFLKNRYWIIRDQVSAAGERQADLWFHFDSGAEPLIEAIGTNRTVVRTSSEAEGLDINVFAGDGRWRREDGWVSKCYGQKAPARVYAFSMPAMGNMEVVTFLLPLSVASGKYVVSEIETVGGKAFEIRHENGLDIVMIRNAEAAQVETERLASDFEWSWASFSSRDAGAPEQLEAAAPEQYLLIDGQRFAVDGKEILKTEERVDHVVNSQISDLRAPTTAKPEVNLRSETEIGN